MISGIKPVGIVDFLLESYKNTNAKNKREAYASLSFLVRKGLEHCQSQYAGGILLPPVQTLVATLHLQSKCNESLPAYPYHHESLPASLRNFPIEISVGSVYT